MAHSRTSSRPRDVMSAIPKVDSPMIQINRLAEVNNRFRGFPRRLAKRLKHAFGPATAEPPVVVWVLGAQRSGTTMFAELFHEDMNAHLFPELSAITHGRFWHRDLNVWRYTEGPSNPRSNKRIEMLRLKDDVTVHRVFNRVRAPLIVAKPLVETQNARRLLAEFPGSKVIFLFRNYHDVVASGYKKWGADAALCNLRPIVEDHQANWRAENVPDEVRKTVRELYRDDMPPLDARALFWWVRNNLFFHQQLDAREDVIVLHYDQLVSEPLQSMQYIYAFLGRPFPGDAIIANIHAQSVGKGRHVELSEEIDRLCSEMYLSLMKVFRSQFSKTDGEIGETE